MLFRFLIFLPTQLPHTIHAIIHRPTPLTTGSGVDQYRRITFRVAYVSY